jgi:ABC-2 type transport system permease protein
VSKTLRKWRAIFSIYFQEGLAYRSSGIIWVLTDLTTGVTMPLVWANASKAGAIAGFNTGDFILYYLCMLLLTGFITCHIMWELAMEIKDGIFSAALIRPISFYQVCFLRNLSWRMIRPVLFLPFFVVLLIAYRPYLQHVTVHLTPWMFASVVLGHLLSFCTVMAVAMIALFVQEATSIFEIYYLPALFLSGTLFPVAVLPAWAKILSAAFPFYYMIGAPTEILVGRVSEADAPHVVAIQLCWVMGMYVFGRVMWSVGLKNYSAVGM